MRIPGARHTHDYPTSNPEAGPTNPRGITGDDVGNRFYVANRASGNNYIEAYDTVAFSNALGQRITTDQAAQIADIEFFNNRVYSSVDGTTGTILAYNPATRAADKPPKHTQPVSYTHLTLPTILLV